MTMKRKSKARLARKLHRIHAKRVATQHADNRDPIEKRLSYTIRGATAVLGGTIMGVGVYGLLEKAQTTFHDNKRTEAKRAQKPAPQPFETTHVSIAAGAMTGLVTALAIGMLVRKDKNKIDRFDIYTANLCDIGKRMCKTLTHLFVPG